MHWLRQRHHNLLCLTLAAWVVAVVVTAFQGCLLEPERNLATPNNSPVATQHADQHAQHTTSCQHSGANTVTAISSIPHTLGLDALSWASLLLLPALVLFIPSEASALPALVLRRLVPSRPPARLIFVRFND